MNLRIRFTTVTPLLQIEESDIVNGIPTTKQKRKEEVYNNTVARFPYFSGNGWRGLLHREISDLVMKKALDKNIKIDATNFHLLSAGGGSNYQTQDLVVELKIRELNPIASIFGLSLAVEGKLMVSDFEPTDKMYKERSNKSGYYSDLIRISSYVKKDELVQGKTGYGRILSLNDLTTYNEENEMVKVQRKDARETGENSVRKLGIQAYNKREYVIAGTIFNGYIGAKKELTDIEKGCLLVGIENVVKKQLGSTHNLGFGVVNYMVLQEDENGSEREVLITSTNEKNIFNPISEVRYSDEERACIKVFNEWLENITEDNILLSKILKSSSK